MSKTKLSEWKDDTLVVLAGNGQRAVELSVKRASYRVAISPKKTNYFTKVPVTAFVTNAGHIWVGPEQDFYIDTDTAVIGGRVFTSNLIWCESLISKKPGGSSSIGQLPDRFEKEVNGLMLSDARNGGIPDITVFMKRSMDLKSVLGRKFFFGDSEQLTSKKTYRAAQMVGKDLCLDLIGFDGQTTASLLIDIEKKKLVKATVDSKQVFPK